VNGSYGMGIEFWVLEDRQDRGLTNGITVPISLYHSDSFELESGKSKLLININFYYTSCA